VVCGEPGSRPLYYAWTEVAPAPAKPLNPQKWQVQPGDVFDTYVTVIGSASRPQIQMQLVNHGPSLDPSKVLWNYSTQTPMTGGNPLVAECITERPTDGRTGELFPLAAFSIAVWGDPSANGCQVSNVTSAAGQRPVYGNPYGWLLVPAQMISQKNGALLANPSGFTTLKSGKQAFQVAAHAPYNSTPRDVLTQPLKPGLTQPPADIHN
jgi:hypothetical protein